MWDKKEERERGRRRRIFPWAMAYCKLGVRM